MAEKESKQFRPEKWILIGILLLIPNSGYLLSFSDASIFYLSNVFLHVALGLLLFVPVLIYGWRYLKREAHAGKEAGLFTGYAGFGLFAAGMIIGLYLTFAGVQQKSTWLLYSHIGLCFCGLVFLVASIRRVGHQISIDNPINTAGRYLLICTSAGVCIPILVAAYKLVFINDDDRIHNPHSAPASMAGEAMGGEQGAFYPSSIATHEQNTIAADFMLTPETCGAAGCHPDIYRQWQSSAHRYSDYKNLWYRKATVEAEQHAGATSTKWCAGCHAPAALLSSEGHAPAVQHAQSPAAHAGISCMVCHAITEVRGTMGQGGFIIEKPALFDMLASKNPLVKNIYSLFVHLDPAPHRDTFRQPFHRNENGAFCSSCHKAHTDAPINQARWLQIMNDYDSWQASSFGQGDRDFVRAEERKDCVTCHLPYVPTQDGKSFVRDHRFLGANTLLPTLNHDEQHLQATIAFLRDNRISLDVFAVSAEPAPTMVPHPAGEARHDNVQVATLIANQNEPLSQNFFTRDSAVVVPLEDRVAAITRGQALRLEVVVRSQDIGHFFPAGAVDMAQAWLELKLVDEGGKLIFWSGATRHEEVDPAAHFYGVEMVDSTGQRTSHERSWEARAAAYINLLPPNSAEVVRYRVQIPEDCGERIQVITKLNYRKYHPAHFQWLNDPSVRQALGGKTPEGAITLPIVEMARAEAALQITASGNHKSLNDTANAESKAERWQNYALGLLRQNELTAAEYAFVQALQFAPDNDDFAINLGIVQLRTGRASEAKAVFKKIAERSKESARAHYYLGMAHKAEGDYRKALNSVKKASDAARRDREFRIEIGRLYHLLGDYERAMRSFKRALRIDPENPVAYHEMMKTYLAKGDEKSAARVEQLYRRFSKDETVKAFERKLHPHGTHAPPHIYHEHHSADPDWLESEATNGHF